MNGAVEAFKEFVELYVRFPGHQFRRLGPNPSLC